MNNQPLAWSEERLERLQEHLAGEWAEDVWVFTPSRPKGRRHFYLRFNLTSPSLKVEMKYAVWSKFSLGQWSRESDLYRICADVHTICAWLNHFTHPLRSLMERELEYWEVSLRSYLVEQGQLKRRSVRQLTVTKEYIEYIAEDRRISLFRRLYTTVCEGYDARPEAEKDVWDMHKMGLSVDLTKSSHFLNFTPISQPWLRHLAKEFMSYRASVQSVGDCQAKLNAIVTFSRFLAQYDTTLRALDIRRDVIIQYIGHLKERGVSASFRRSLLAGLRVFLETCVYQLGIADLTRERVIFDDDLPKISEWETRELPEGVLEQLRNHLHTLPTALLRMVVILLECGMRCSELCALPLDCLVRDDKHEWYLRFYQGKSKQEHIIPLVNETVIEAIQAQQQEVRERLGASYPYLFPSFESTDAPFKQASLRRILNRWAVEADIRDAAGKLYHFQPHQFRHTVVMRLINEDVPLDVISRLLGHHSLAMTQVYARKRTATLSGELQRATRKSRTVNYQGQTVTGDIRAADPEVQLTRKQVCSQTLPVGGCGRLVILGRCPHANTCLTCDFWLTSTGDLPALKAFHDKAVGLKQRAQQKKNLAVLQNQEAIIPLLARRIESLEREDEDADPSTNELLHQLREDLLEAQVGYEEACEARSLLAAKRLERNITELQARIDELESISGDAGAIPGPDD